ncbi:MULTISPECIES: hypothetical protein [Sorangium]|uniref:Uncharacterized protein n=1 Tax=Sorangium cellulosum TaxID=56 RepID=A0A4V0NG47_SORCE|nr:MULTISPECIES: hypothetical protein [Sorangium]AUX31912.1 uncharacterized protein SOCE836_040470 [Sorangium cellulosum]WCQ91286.1 hypothetical protein NQZ70_04002 [Sorangium sp. Soce836]
MANAKFTINGSASSNRGYDTTAASNLILQLEDQPALDVFRCQYSQVAKTKNAPDLTIPNGGEPATPAGTLTVTGVPSGVHAWKLRCVVNHGVDANGNVVPGYTFERIVAIRSGGLRKIITGETGEYDPTYGWPEAYNEYLTTAGIVGADVNLANTWSQPQTFSGNVICAGNVLGSGSPSTGAPTYFHLQSENQSAGNTSRAVALHSGDTVSATSGQASLSSGVATSGASGHVYVNSGLASVSSGNVYIFPGPAPTVGNVSLGHDSPNFQGMQRGMFIRDALALPTANPSSGGFMFAETGALKWRGPSGTITTIAPADPHCPSCGRDFVTQHVNGDNELSICLCCLVDTLEDAGIDVGRFAFVRNLGAP